VLQPLGVTGSILKNWVIGGAGYLAPPGLLSTTDLTRLALPLLADLKYLHLGFFSIAKRKTYNNLITTATGIESVENIETRGEITPLFSTV